MGQYWDVFNIDKMETLDLSGAKMGEWFFTSCTTHIVQALSRDQMLKDYRDFRAPLSGSWAGDRIICLGDYAEIGDMPAGLFSQEQLKDLGYGSKKAKDEGADEDGEESDDEEYGIQAVLSGYSKRKELSDFYRDYSWGVLRNLSKKEYIRGGPSVPAMWEYEGGFPDIGTKFFSLICWSSDSTVNMRVPDGVDVSRGRWAGDRFDLVALVDVEEELETDGWKDVSQEVEETLARIKKVNK